MNKLTKTVKLLLVFSFSFFIYNYIENNPNAIKSLQVKYGKYGFYGHGDFTFLILK